MKTISLQTPRLRLVLKTAEEVRAAIETMDAADKAQLSADWLARFRASTSPDPWVHGFSMASDQESKGYATEAARALVAYAFSVDQVNRVRAHTLPASNASMRVLAKCGFQYVSEINDPEDGLVCRFETTKPQFERTP
jgi:[ribosomal protein S5]-alanine N-acetyltransferase